MITLKDNAFFLFCRELFCFAVNFFGFAVSRLVLQWTICNCGDTFMGHRIEILPLKETKTVTLILGVSQGFWETREHWQNIEGNKGTLPYFLGAVEQNFTN